MYARKLRALIECGLHVTLSVRVDDVHMAFGSDNMCGRHQNSNSKYYYFNFTRKKLQIAYSIILHYIFRF